MPNSTSRKRVTVIASIEGVERAEKALIRLSFESKSNFAKSQLIARNAVTKFFNRSPIQPDTFRRICNGLKLNWEELLETESVIKTAKQQKFRQPEKFEGGMSTANQGEGFMQAISRQVTVIDNQNEIKAVIVLQGDITSIDANFKTTLEVLLKGYGGCTIQVTDIQAGSIRITIKGSQRDVERIFKQVVAGELTQVHDLPIQNIQLLGEETLEETENLGSWNKWDAIQEIINHPAKSRHLSSMDLSDSDLSDVDLSDVDLSFANLRGADLSGADLSFANLRGAIINEETRIDGKWRLVWRIVNRRGIEAVLIRLYLNFFKLSRDSLNRKKLTPRNLKFIKQILACLDFVYLVQAYRFNPRLIHADLSYADLSGSDLSLANLSYADLSGTNLSFANLRGANLSGANPSGADLSFANLRGVIIDEETRIDAKWCLAWEVINRGGRNANLSGADLSFASLRGANLSGANLSGANLSGADLPHANLHGTDLRGANLYRANLQHANLHRAKVQNAYFGQGVGLSRTERHALAQQGAIFNYGNDAPDDHESTYSPVRR